EGALLTPARMPRAARRHGGGARPLALGALAPCPANERVARRGATRPFDPGQRSTRRATKRVLTRGIGANGSFGRPPRIVRRLRSVRTTSNNFAQRLTSYGRSAFESPCT